MSCCVLELPPPTTVSTATCDPRGCAGLCTDEGLQAAHRAYRRRLLSRARLVVVDPDLAEDAVQEAFVRAWRNCSSFDPTGGPLLNWLLVITRNVAVDLVKARTRRPPVASAQVDAAVDESSAVISGPDLVVLRDQLTQALTSIGPEHRAAVVETILRDRPYAELAAELGVPAGTVRSRVHYGLRRLRDLLEADGAAA